MERTKKIIPLSSQLKKKVNNPTKISRKEYDGDFGTVISTGSTLLDLAISGGRVRGGGLPGGILVEAFGPSGSGKTVLLSEIAGDVQRKGGDVKFEDPEARLNKPFARMFGLELKKENYSQPNTINEVFTGVRNWKPEGVKKAINGVFADSTAALSTEMEMDKAEGDKMGMRRAKEFSEQLRKTCRIIAKKNYLMVCSNQVRVNVDPMSYQKYNTPGGEAFGFYSSLRLRFNKPEKIKGPKLTIGKKTVQRVIGVEVLIEVFKSSIWKPFRTAPVTILFNYGIDDIRQNLQFIKDHTKNKVYMINDRKLGVSLEDSIHKVEDQGLEEELKEQVITLWEKIERRSEIERKPKR